MDHFENIVRLLLESEGYWVQSSFKVNLTKEEKSQTGKPTIPRPEIDLIAYKPNANEILAIEVKSFFDSGGVNLKSLTEKHKLAKGKYKLFTTMNYRNIVFGRLKTDLFNQGLVIEQPTIRLGLVAGNVKKADTESISSFMKSSGYFYWSPTLVRQKVERLSKTSYENEAIYIAAKILLRH